MNETMKEVLERLDLLAANLNTTGEHLWEMLTRQGYIEGFYSVIWAIIAVVYCFYFCKNIQKLFVKANDKNSSTAEEGFSIMCIVIGLLFFVGCIVSLFINTYAIGNLINPEYFALQEILGG